MTVFLTKVGPICSAGMIGVLNKIHSILHIAGSTEVDGVHAFGSYLLRPLKVLVVTHFIGDVLIPCGI